MDNDNKITIEIPGHLFTGDLKSIEVVRSKRGELYIIGYKLKYKEWWEFWK